MITEEFLKELNSKNDFEGEFLREQRELARRRGVPVMLEETARFLSMLIGLNKPKKILEVGMAVGYSASLILRHAAKNARLTTIEIDEKSIEIAKENFKNQGLADRIRIIEGDASEIIPYMSGEFDFIFLDGPKSRYSEYFPFLKKMLIPNGVLVSDNVLFRDMISGETKMPHRMNTIVHNMRDYLDKLSQDEDFATEIFDIGDGISVSIRKSTKEI